MASVMPDYRRVNVRQLFETALSEAHQALLRALSTRMTNLLNQAVDQLLGRERYERRGHVPDDVQGGECPYCHTRQSDRFTRHGGRKRTVTIWWGDLHVRWPRVICACGHCVKLNLLGWLEPYQRLGEDVDVLIQRWGAMSLSLRQMAKELAHTYIGPLGLRTLNERLHQLQELTPDLDEVATPPVLQVDGIYITQLRPNGEMRTDRKGRKRAVKGRFKRCVLVALGLWPETGRQEVLAWELTDGEGFMPWLNFLSRLEAQGLSAENGLRLIIHDGGTGLCAALRFLDLGVAEQRCIFHKLRNISKALQLPADLDPEERRRKRKAIMRDFKGIWQAKQYATILRRYLQVYRQYRSLQPAAVATLRRDFRATLAYYRLAQEYPAWQRRFLRTTSHLERFNRRLRKRCRTAGAYHSDDGLLAMIAQTADEAFQPGTPASARRHTVPTV
jgi:hypothetical protein